MITIIDYGLGNIRAFANIYKRLNVPFTLARTKDDLQEAEKIILPGVGAFDHAMQQLEESGMLDVLNDLVLNKSVPVIGICVGMQMLANSSEEGNKKGLGWIDGTVRKIDTAKIHQSTLLPHMGWNTVKRIATNKLLEGFDDHSKFYFLHSYYFECNSGENSIAVCNYGQEFTCAVNKGNIYGVQFHPEKSHQYGIQLLKNFAFL
jgi:imidazole glycerol-phosphate synthase subunit HisH